MASGLELSVMGIAVTFTVLLLLLLIIRSLDMFWGSRREDTSELEKVAVIAAAIAESQRFQLYPRRDDRTWVRETHREFPVN